MDEVRASDDDVISLSELLEQLLKGWKWIVGSTVLFFCGALFYLWITPAVYRASALIEIDAAHSHPAGVVSSAAEIEKIFSEVVLGKVVHSEHLNFQAQPRQLPLIGSLLAKWSTNYISVASFQVPAALAGKDFTLVANSSSRYTLLLDGQLILQGQIGQPAVSQDKQVTLLVANLIGAVGDSFEIKHFSDSDAIAALIKRLSITEKGRDTNILKIALTGTNQYDNIRQLNSVIEHYSLQHVEQMTHGLEKQLDVVNYELNELEKQPQNSETATDNTPYASSTYNTKYVELLAQARRLKVDKASVFDDVRVLSPVMPEKNSIKPKKLIVLLLAALLGGMVGVGLVLLRRMMDTSVKDAAEIERKTGQSIYAVITESNELHALEARAKAEQKAYLLASAVPDDLSMERLRTLRTNLLSFLPGQPNNRVMLTSPTKGVGKSFVTANLAMLLANGGQKVLLIDADMRKGRIQTILGLQLSRGLAEVLSDHKGSDAIISVNPMLDFLASGHPPVNPSELLMMPQFSQLLDKLSPAYDVVLINTPPVLSVTDPGVVGAQCGTTFLIARTGLSHIKDITLAARYLDQAGVAIKGCVLNGASGVGARFNYVNRKMPV